MSAALLLLSADRVHAAPAAVQAQAAPNAAQPTPAAARVTPPAAAPAATRGAPPAPASALHAAEAKLASDDPAAVRHAIDALAQLGGEPAATAIATRLRRGLPPQLIEHAIDALARIGKPSAGPVLIELTLHRRPQVRKRAVDGIGALKVRSAQSVLLYALDDPSADVREAAVQALGVTGTARALPALFEAAERGLPSALAAVGRIAGARDVKAVMAHAKNGDVTRIKPALQIMLERSDFPVQAKVAVVRELATLGSGSARNHLVQWLDSWKTTGDPRLRQALFDAIKRLDGIDEAATTRAKAAPAPAGTRPEVASVNAAPHGAPR
jgi:HEAT repeat protein